MEPSQKIETTFNSSNFYFSHNAEQISTQINHYRHNHSRYELYVFFGGDASFVIEDKVFRMEPNTLLLIPPHTYHYATIRPSQGPYDRLVINFDHNFVYPELHALLKTDINPAGFDAEKHAMLLKDVEDNLAHYKKRDAALLVQLFLNRLLIDLKYTQKAESGAELLNPTITLILDYINEHLHEPLSLKIIAEQTFLNQSYLSQVFSAHMKIGLMDYIKQKKIYLAEELMREENMTPTEASSRLGFNDYSTFYRLYKKYIGSTPSAVKAR